MNTKCTGGLLSGALWLYVTGCSTAAAEIDPPELDLGYGAGETETLTVDGVEASYLDKGDGPAVVFYHPSVDLRYWQWAVEAMAPEFRAIALPSTDSFVPNDSPSDVSALVSIIEDLDATPAHLVAHSWGGRQALELAIARPDLLASLVVVEPALAPDPGSLEQLGAAFAQSDATCPLPDLDDSLLAGCVLQVQINEADFFDNAPSSLIRILMDTWAREAAAAAAANQSTTDGPSPIQIPPLAPICKALGEIDMPVLFVRGALTPEPIQTHSLDAYETCLPPHESVTIPDSAHYPHVYEPDAFNDALLGFLHEL